MSSWDDRSDGEFILDQLLLNEEETNMGWNKKQEVKKEEYVNTGGASSTGAVGTAEQAPLAQGTQGTATLVSPALADGWKQVEGKQDGDFYTFKEIGETLTGIYEGDFTAGINPFGRPNHNGRIRTPEGVAIVNMSANLKRQLLAVQVGKEVKVIYQGKKLNAKTHNYYHDFTVLVKG